MNSLQQYDSIWVWKLRFEQKITPVSFLVDTILILVVFIEYALSIGEWLLEKDMELYLSMLNYNPIELTTILEYSTNLEVLNSQQMN